MEPRAVLMLPPKGLSSCIAAAVMRDIRGAGLAEGDRFNYFPATPMVTVTFVIEGTLRLCGIGASVAEAKTGKMLERVSATLPQNAPIASWGSLDACAVSVAFYPDAWTALVEGDARVVPETVWAALQCFGKDGEPSGDWDRFCQTVAPFWQARRVQAGTSDWGGSDRMSDWSRYLFSRIAMSTAGQGMRTFERHMRRWTGQSRQTLEFATIMEDLYRRRVAEPDLPLADLAVETGFSDQSHMGRAVRRTTGFSPARLNKMIETEESFWCYRLLGERY